MEIIFLKNKRLLLFSIASLVAFISFFIITKDYLVGDFVFEDDAIYLTKYIFGVGDELSHRNLSHFLINLVSVFDSVALIKFSWLLIHSMSAGLLAVFLCQHGCKPLLAIVLSLVVFFVPVSGDQIIFVTGSHPGLALTLVLFALVLFKYDHDSTERRKFCMLIVFILLVLASLSSATALLAPLALPFWILTRRYHPEEKHRSRIAAAFIFMVLCLLFGLLTQILGPHHYTSNIGWIDISIDQISANYSNTLKYLKESVLPEEFFVYELLLVLLSGLFFPVAWKYRKCKWAFVFQELKDFNPLPLDNVRSCINLLFLSGLMFGPISILTELHKRYLIALSSLLLLSIIMLFLRVLHQKRSGINVIIGLVMFGLLSINIINTWQTHEYILSPFYDTYSKMTMLVNEEDPEWPINAQILIMTPSASQTPTYAFNHWSTWYLRLLTKRLDIIGLVGRPQDISRAPFVDKYQDNGPDYWEVVEGRSARIRMIGLEKNRPLFSYRENPSGNYGGFDRIDSVVFMEEDENKIVHWGKSYKYSMSVPGEVPKQSGEIIYRWPTIH